jgi:hypothetical protein
MRKGRRIGFNKSSAGAIVCCTMYRGLIELRDSNAHFWLLAQRKPTFRLQPKLAYLNCVIEITKTTGVHQDQSIDRVTSPKQCAGEIVGLRTFLFVEVVSQIHGPADAIRSTHKLTRQLIRFGPKICLLGFHQHGFPLTVILQNSNPMWERAGYSA